MIKLESKSVLPSAVASLEIKSFGSQPSISLTTDEVRENVGGQWKTAESKAKQVVTFIGADGTACSLEGTVELDQAVEMAAAHKIVVQIRVANELKAAFQAGRVSRSYTSLEIVRVVEVWDTAANCIWKAKDGLSAAPAREIDLSGGKAKVA